nr:hypothetical protein [Tessaracoccus coleopterorum]
MSASPTSCSRRAPARRPWRSPSTGPTGSACSGSMCGSTSGWPPSPRSASHGRAAGPSPSSQPLAPPSPTWFPRPWRPPSRASRCCCSPPTGPPTRSAQGPARPESRSAWSAPPPSTSRAFPRRPGAGGLGGGRAPWGRHGRGPPHQTSGAVQLNLEFEEPLVGELPPPEPRRLRVSRSLGTEIVELDDRRTVVLAGDASPAVGAEARALAEVSGAPLFAEPTSNARSGPNAIPGYRHALLAMSDGIERVVMFGHPTLSRPVNALLRRDDVELVVVTDSARWHDPGHRAAIIADRVQLDPQDPAWLDAWRAFPWRPRARPSGSGWSRTRCSHRSTPART